MDNNNPTSGGIRANDEPSRAASSKIHQSASTGGKMWASSDGLIDKENCRDLGIENIELLTPDSGQRQSPYPETLFFRDGQRKIDFVLVYQSGGDDEVDPKAATRKKYQENLVRQHGLELEEEASLQVSIMRSVKVGEYLACDIQPDCKQFRSGFYNINCM